MSGNDLTDDSWYVVRNTPRVTGFVGAGVNPVPLKKEEVEYSFKKMDAAQLNTTLIWLSERVF